MEPSWITLLSASSTLQRGGISVGIQQNTKKLGLKELYGHNEPLRWIVGIQDLAQRARIQILSGMRLVVRRYHSAPQ